MGLFESIFSRKEKERIVTQRWESLTPYAPVFRPWQGNIYDNELIRAAVHGKAAHISKLSIAIEGTAQPVTRNRLKNQPNDFMTWSQFLYRASLIFDLYNNCIIVPVIDKYGNTTGIYPVLPQGCEIVEYNGIPYCKYTFHNGKTATIELSKCGILRKHQVKNEIFGDGNNVALKPTLEMIDLQNQALRESVKNSATYRFYASISNFVLPEDLVKERERFSEKNLKKNGGGILLFPNTYNNIHQITPQNYTIDKDTMEQIRTNIFDYFGINEDILQGKANESSLNAFYNLSIEPFAIQLSEVLTKMLFTRIEQSTGNRVIVSSSRLQYMSTESKIDLAKTLSDRGCITINEMRELFNYPGIGEAGDKMLARGEYYDVVEGKENVSRETSPIDSQTEIEPEEESEEVIENAEE